MSAVIVDQLYKSYGKTRALNGVSFSVDEGELYGIIGPDGAGKSTLFRVLTGRGSRRFSAFLLP